MKTHLLIDGDVVAFIAASAVQKVIEDDEGMLTYMADPREGEIAVEQIMAKFLHKVDPEAAKRGDITYEVILSGPDNWRFDVDPNYKGNRKDSVRPMLLDRLKNYLRDKHGAWSYPNLEADDTLGILATTPGYKSYPLREVTGELIDDEHPRIIVIGRDKDFLSIPGEHHQYGQTNDDGSLLVFTVTLEAGDRWHHVQTLSGDMTDGYPGCPGLGKKRAEDIVDAQPMLRLEPQRGVITRGPNKGKSTVKWVGAPTSDIWEVIVSNYEKAGQGELEALTTARLARILRYGEYNPETGEVTLWTPTRKEPA